MNTRNKSFPANFFIENIFVSVARRPLRLSNQQYRKKMAVAKVKDPVALIDSVKVDPILWDFFK